MPTMLYYSLGCFLSITRVETAMASLEEIYVTTTVRQ